MTIYLSEDQIADNFVSDLVMLSQTSKHDIMALKDIPRYSMSRYHSTIGMHIRNKYKLWDSDNPLTAEWFKDRDAGRENYIVDGIDQHPNHPDAVSSEILRKIWDRAQLL